MNPIVIAIIGSVGASVVEDINGFLSAKKADPKAAFDTGIFAARVARGLILGLMVGIGANQVPV